MLNIGTGEIIVIALLALIVLGPDKLPQAARQVGHYTAEARKIADGFRHEMQSAIDEVTDTVTPPDERAADRQLDAPPTGATPIDVEPAEAKPLTPPGGRATPVRPDDPSSN